MTRAALVACLAMMVAGLTFAWIELTAACYGAQVPGQTQPAYSCGTTGAFAAVGVGVFSVGLILLVRSLREDP